MEGIRRQRWWTDPKKPSFLFCVLSGTAQQQRRLFESHLYLHTTIQPNCRNCAPRHVCKHNIDHTEFSSAYLFTAHANVRTICCGKLALPSGRKWFGHWLSLPNRWHLCSHVQRQFFSLCGWRPRRSSRPCICPYQGPDNKHSERVQWPGRLQHWRASIHVVGASQPRKPNYVPNDERAGLRLPLLS